MKLFGYKNTSRMHFVIDRPNSLNWRQRYSHYSRKIACLIPGKSNRTVFFITAITSFNMLKMHNDLEPYAYRNMRSLENINKKKSNNTRTSQLAHMGPVLIKHKFLMICLFLVWFLFHNTRDNQLSKIKLIYNYKIHVFGCHIRCLNGLFYEIIFFFWWFLISCVFFSLVSFLI